jgi:putative transcriptional regulator
LTSARPAFRIENVKRTLLRRSRLKFRVVNKVREQRLRAGMTQQELGAACGVSRQSIISIERGRYVPSLALSLQLARIFSYPTDELFHLVEVRR